jgi:cell wall-associated NlpC family hydrolase
MILKKTHFIKIPVLLVLFIITFGIGYALINANKKQKQANTTPIVESPIAPISKYQTLRDSIVTFGMQLLGTPYSDGACGLDGFDCSGFVYYVFKHFNIQVPRSSSLFENFGETIPIDQAKKGDVIVFLSPTRSVIGHVGIVTHTNGMETEFIHATSGKEMKVVISSLKQDSYKKRFVKAVNVLGGR